MHCFCSTKNTLFFEIDLFETDRRTGLSGSVLGCSYKESDSELEDRVQTFSTEPERLPLLKVTERGTWRSRKKALVLTSEMKT